MAILRVGNYGMALEVDCQRDVSSATVKQIILRSPSGRVLAKEAAFSTDGVDGLLRYVLISGDLSEAGDWQLQPYVEMPGFAGHGAVVQFQVAPNLRKAQ